MSHRVGKRMPVFIAKVLVSGLLVSSLSAVKPCPEVDGILPSDYTEGRNTCQPSGSLLSPMGAKGTLDMGGVGCSGRPSDCAFTI